MTQVGQSRSTHTDSAETADASLDAAVPSPGDWRAEILAQVRRLIEEADSAVTEEVKWRKPSNAMAGVPTWSRAGIICTGETYRDKVKLTFAKGAALDDPTHLFNASLDGGTRRAIDIRQGDRIDAAAFKTLIRAAAALNAAAKSSKRPNRASS